MKIALAGPYPAGTLEQFQALLPDQTFFSVESQEDYEALTDVDCIIVRVLKTPEAILANKPNLKAVIRWGAGYDSVDVQAAGRRGIPVLNTPGVNAYAVAELALGMMITLNRKVLGYWNNVQQGNWDRGAFASLSLNHKTVGIVGGGNIGRRVAALVQALGAQVVYYDAFRLPPEREQELHMTYAPLEELTAVTARSETEQKTAINAGNLILIHDGQVAKVARGVNSLTTIPATGNADWSKIKIVEGMDLITYYLRTTIQGQYIGRYPNTYDNKCLLLTAIREYFAYLESAGVLNPGESWAEIDLEAQERWLKAQGVETADLTEQQLKEYQTGSWVFIQCGGRLVDAMEDFQVIFHAAATLAA